MWTRFKEDQMRKRVRRLFGAMVRRRMTVIARVQTLLRRLGGRHKWRLAAVKELHARKVERRVRHALRRFSRFIHSAKGRIMSVTMEPFAFMGPSEYVLELRVGYRGLNYIRDSQGRYHQQLKAVTMQVPMVDTYGLRELAVLWCWGTEGVEEGTQLKGAIPENTPTFKMPWTHC